MKTKILFLVANIIIWGQTLKAQDNNIKLDEVVNEQFGTLLETLIKDGKIDEIGAKTYLETVFGYDEGISNYLQTVDFSQKISNFKQGNVSLENYLGTLSNSLVGLMPVKYQSEIQKNIQVQALLNGSMNEIASGQLGENSYQLVDGIIQGINDIREQLAKQKLLLEKIKAITPTLNSLNKISSPKREKYTVPMTKDNWNEISNPDWSKKTARLSQAILTDKGVEFTGEWKNFAPPTYKFYKYFKNTERFDFSKDFRATFEISVDETNNYNFFDIQLAGMYQMQLMFYKKKAFTMTTPKKYFFTNKYGVFYNTMFTQPFGFKNVIINKKPCVDYTKPIKVIMEKIGNKLTFKFNDCTEVSTIEMDYFYNKYALDFKVEGKVNLHSLTLEHL